MSTPCEEIRPELEALLGALTEGKLEADGRKRLAAILREHPDARQFYLDYCQMHALLQSAHGVLQALETPSKTRKLRAAWIASAAAVLVVAGLSIFLRDASHIDAAVAPVQGSTWIVRGGERIQLAASGELRSGDRLVTGPDSRSDVRLRDGTRLLLLDRTEIELGERIQLKEGTLRCEVAPQHQPLVFRTPHAEARVLGTEFELSAAWKETRLRTLSGLVRLSVEGKSVDVGPGQVAVADGQGVVRWESVCSLDFSKMKELPSQMTAAFCYSDLLHTPDRKIESGADRVRLTDKGLTFGPVPGQKHGLVDYQWKDAVGDDVILEVDVAAGTHWGLGIALSGTGFDGYRAFFAAIDEYPNGVAIDTIWPKDLVILARDPRGIDYTRDHTLRVERHGKRIRAWVDGQIRIDTELTHPLGESRKRTFSLCNFGAYPTIRALRVWKAAS